MRSSNMMTKKSKFRNNSLGFSMVEVLIATGIMTAVGMGTIGLQNISQQNSVRLRAARVAFNARAMIESALKNPAAWEQTLTRNQALYCGTKNAGCSLSSTADGYYDFVLFGSEPNQKLTYDPSDSTTRFGLSGAMCPSTEPNPSGKCPIKFIAKWKPICATYPCLNPTLDVRVTMMTEFEDGSAPINPKKYNYSIFRGVNEDALQSACFILNGTFNVTGRNCVPKFSGKTCASIGKPAQVVSAVHADGSIECSPLYRGSCDPATQQMGGIDSTGLAQCRAKAACVPNTDCVGSWGACSSSTCAAGTQTYSITTPVSGTGAACPFASGDTRSCTGGGVCPPPVDCSGSWTACNQACGSGTMTYLVTTPASGGGAACPAADGDTQVCNTQSCAVPVNCGGYWNVCNSSTGQQDFVVTQAPQNGGAACPASPQSCPVDCSGGWSGCISGVKTYTWFESPKNGGASCPYANGQTDTGGCKAPSVCRWGYADITPNKYWNYAQVLKDLIRTEAGACYYPNDETCDPPCSDYDGQICGGAGQVTSCMNPGSGGCCSAGGGPCPCISRPLVCKCS